MASDIILTVTQDCGTSRKAVALCLASSVCKVAAFELECVSKVADLVGHLLCENREACAASIPAQTGRCAPPLHRLDFYGSSLSPPLLPTILNNFNSLFS